MPRHDNFPAFRTWRRQRKMRKSGLKKMNTGLLRTLSRRMVLAVGASVTLISSMSKVNRAAVSRNGSRWLEVGHRRRVEILITFFIVPIFASIPYLFFFFDFEHRLGHRWSYLLGLHVHIGRGGVVPDGVKTDLTGLHLRKSMSPFSSILPGSSSVLLVRFSWITVFRSCHTPSSWKTVFSDHRVEPFTTRTTN